MTMAFCRSRKDGRRCTRALDHPGLHKHRTMMWNGLGADPPRCPGSGLAASPAPEPPEEFPHGRAVCPRCHAFVDVVDGRLAEHDAGVDDVPHEQRAEWFNSHGW